MDQQAVPGPSHEPHDPGLGSRLNWLRAGVLGANDGIVSTAAIILGFSGATDDRAAVLTAGCVGLLAGAMSMAVGEYVSVSTQRDAEKAALAMERRELAEDPQGELAELAGFYRAKGLDPDLAHRVAEQLSERDALAAHAEMEFGVDPDELTDPYQAAGASFLSFVVGALVPLLAVVLSPAHWMTAVAVAVALAVTGTVSARLGRAPVARAVIRNVLGGVVAMAVTYLLGGLVGTVTG
ncbi:VIT1/CCC1 transporter family protein [Nakamurella leprariae]|uniref:VIT family protein n=1 Tax=Nakamurella leprariae TaxID=2803911 RepID=A0A939C2N6_9ACTN|nr:VIT family protein [Nakamurella leprariae]MBM9468297.1 VIT family protein [Nakamurella leprariae]